MKFTRTTGNPGLDREVEDLLTRIAALEAAAQSKPSASAPPVTAPAVINPAADPGIVNPMSAAGDIIVGGVGGLPTRLAAGADTKVLTLSGGTPVWSPNIGAKGDPGIYVVGADGIDGEDGIPGPQGAQGQQGIPGSQGHIGWGMDGEDGEQGVQGPPGIAGPTGLTGSVGGIGPQGIMGFGMDGLDGMDAWPMPGPAGPAGAAGAGGSSTTIGTYAGRPGASSAGALYFCTDNGFLYIDRATYWERVPAGGDVPAFTTDAQAPTIVTNYGVERITGTGNGAEKWYGRYIAAPATPYTITAQIISQFSWSNYNDCGLYFSDGTKIWSAVMGLYSANTYAEIRLLGNTTTFGSVPASVSLRGGNGLTAYVWHRIKDDGTNLTYWISWDGQNWDQIYTALRGAYLATGPTRVGWGLNPVSGAGVNTATLMSWLQT